MSGFAQYYWQPFAHPLLQRQLQLWAKASLSFPSLSTGSLRVLMDGAPHCHSKVMELPPHQLSPWPAVWAHISFHSPRIKPVFIDSYLFLETGKQLREVHLFLSPFHASEWGKFFFMTVSHQVEHSHCWSQPAAVTVLMDLPCRCWEVPYIIWDNSFSMHSAWKDEWQEKHEALGKEAVDTLNICAALKCHRNWLESPAAFPEMLDSSLLTGKWGNMLKTSSLGLKAHGAADIARLFCCKGQQQRSCRQAQAEAWGLCYHRGAVWGSGLESFQGGRMQLGSAKDWLSQGGNFSAWAAQLSQGLWEQWPPARSGTGTGLEWPGWGLRWRKGGPDSPWSPRELWLGHWQSSFPWLTSILHGSQAGSIWDPAPRSPLGSFWPFMALPLTSVIDSKIKHRSNISFH